jgi:hypothetical protein
VAAAAVDRVVPGVAVEGVVAGTAADGVVSFGAAQPRITWGLRFDEALSECRYAGGRLCTAVVVPRLRHGAQTVIRRPNEGPSA